MSERTLILSGRDVRTLLTMKDCVDTQEEVFALNAQGKAWCGPNAWIHPDANLQAHPAEGKFMAGGIEPDWYGVKSIFYAEYDPEARNRVQILTIFDSKTLCPRAIVECLYIGNVRTGAGAAVATKYMARPDARVIGILGSGAVARFSLLAHHAIEWPATEVLVYSRSQQRREQFCQEMVDETGYNVKPVDNPEEVVRKSEILITGASTQEPILKSEWVQAGTHVNAMGQKWEIDPELYTRTVNVGDEEETAIRDGKLSVAIQAGVITEKAVLGGLGELVDGTKTARNNDNDVTLFDSSGLLVQDLATGLAVWKLAQEKGMGQPAEFYHDDRLE